MQRRSFLAGVGVAAAGALLAGCSGRTGSSETTTGRTTLQFFNDAASWGPGYVASGKIMKSKVGISLAPQTIPNASSYEQVVRSLLQTKIPPDLVKWGSGYRTKDLARTGGLADLTDIWEESVGKNQLNDDLRPDFSYKGKVYGLPLVQGYYVMFYNVATFKRLDIKTPTTWDEFIQACETLKSAGITPIGTTQQNIWPVANWFSVLSAAYDPDWYKALCNNDASFTDNAGIGLLTLWQDMIRKGYHTSADSVNNDFPSQMNKNKVGMYPAAISWATQDASKTGLKPGTGYDTFILPSVQNKKRSVITEVAGIVAPKGSGNLANTRKGLRVWLDADVQEPWRDFQRGSSGNPTIAWTDPVAERLRKEITEQNVNVLNRYWEGSPPSLVVGVTQDLGGFMANPSDPKAVAKSLNTKAKTEWSYWKEATK